MKEMPQDKPPGKECRSCDYRKRLTSQWFGARLPRAIGGKCGYRGFCEYATKLDQFWEAERNGKKG